MRFPNPLATPYHCRYCEAKRVCSDPREKCPECRAIADTARVERERDYKRDWMRAARERKSGRLDPCPAIYDDAIREIAHELGVEANGYATWPIMAGEWDRVCERAREIAHIPHFAVHTTQGMVKLAKRREKYARKVA